MNRSEKSDKQYCVVDMLIIYLEVNYEVDDPKSYNYFFSSLCH